MAITIFSLGLGKSWYVSGIKICAQAICTSNFSPLAQKMLKLRLPEGFGRFCLYKFFLFRNYQFFLVVVNARVAAIVFTNFGLKSTFGTENMEKTVIFGFFSTRSVAGHSWQQLVTIGLTWQHLVTHRDT